MKNSIWIYCIVLVFFSCEKELPIHSNFGKKITLYSKLDTDNKVKIVLYESEELSDSLSLYYISDATVELFENGIKISTLSYVIENYFLKDGYYTDNSIHIKPNKVYTIKATHPNFPSITATDTVPSFATVTNNTVTGYPLYIINQDSTFANLEFTIVDDANKHNVYVVYPYYYISRYFRSSPTDSELIWQTNYAHINALNGILANSNFTINQLDDATFNGQAKQFNLEISKLYDFDNSIEEAYVGVSIRQYSSSYYLDLESQRQYNELLSNNIFDTPFWFYSNVVGGFGVLSSTSNYNQIIAKIK